MKFLCTFCGSAIDAKKTNTCNGCHAIYAISFDRNQCLRSISVLKCGKECVCTKEETPCASS